MQDAYIVHLSADGSELDYFGVFDGHGPNGEHVARYCANHLGDVVEGQMAQLGEFSASIETGCMLLDEQLRIDPKLKDVSGKVLGGTTCNIVWVSKKQIYSCNVGDSRFILCYNGKPVAISEDHKPYLITEKQRIYRAGGHIYDMRVNGILGVSRTFGDFAFKNQRSLPVQQQLVSCLPDIRTVDKDKNIQFLVIASDGIWDMLTNDEVVEIIVRLMEQQVPLPQICEQLIDNCRIPIDPVSGLGSDNMTVIIALFR